MSYALLGARPSIHISHEPEGYPALKADARAIARWQGPGARVSHIAWPESLPGR
jgi:hypothetical protein